MKIFPFEKIKGWKIRGCEYLGGNNGNVNLGGNKRCENLDEKRGMKIFGEKSGANFFSGANKRYEKKG